MSILATVAVMVVISLTIDSTRTESTLLARTSAEESVAAVRSAFEEELAVSPTFFYSYVFPHERARVCTRDGDAVIEPGSLWPAACGAVWAYQQASSPGATRMEITPPGPDDSRLQVRIISRSGNWEAGVDIYYALDSLGRFTLADENGLNLDDLPTSGTTTVAGEVYSGGEMTLPAFSIGDGRGTFAAEGGFNPGVEDAPIGGGSARFYSATSDLDAAIIIDDIREVVDSAVDFDGLHGAVVDLVERACPGTSPTLLDGRASHVCLTPGGEVVNVGGDVVAIPESADTFLALPGVSSTGSIDVYYSSTVSEAVVDCAGECDLASESIAATSAGTHPGAASYWTLLDTVAVSDTGVVAASRDIHIGLCGVAFTQTAGTCTDWDGSGGIEVAENTTFVAGTLLDPADIYLSGPIYAADGVSVGGVAVGQVLLPYWARAVGTDGYIHGSYVGLGIGTDAPEVSTLPTGSIPSGNVADTLYVVGGLAGASIDTTFPLYSDVELQEQPRHLTAPPPLFPSWTGTWRVVESLPVGSLDVCGEVTCSDW